MYRLQVSLSLSLSLSLRQTDTSNKRFSQCLISNSIIFIFKRKRVPSTRLFADPPSGDECTDGAPDLGPTDGTLSNGRGTQDTATQVTAGQEDNAHLRVQTDLTRLLFPEQAVLLSQIYKQKYLSINSNTRVYKQQHKGL